MELGATTAVKLAKAEREAIARARGLAAFTRYWHLKMYMRGLTLDQVIQIWFDAQAEENKP